MSELLGAWTELQLGSGKPFGAAPCSLDADGQAKLFRLIGAAKGAWDSKCWHAKFTNSEHSPPLDIVRINSPFDSDCSREAEQSLGELTQRHDLGKVRRREFHVGETFRKSCDKWGNDHIARFLPIWRDWSREVTTALAQDDTLKGEALAWIPTVQGQVNGGAPQRL